MPQSINKNKMQKEENRRNKRENTVDAKKGKTITGIAILAIMLASVFGMLIGGTGAYSMGGEYNIIKNDGGAGVQPVLIGQDLDFSAEWVGTVTVSRVFEDAEEWSIVADAQNHIHVSEVETQWTRPGAFYVNYVDATTYDGQLSVSTPCMPLKLKIGTKEVSSIAVGSHLTVDVSGINLFGNDVVDLVIIGPNGQIEYDPINNQDFTDITVENLADWYGADNLVTKGWDIGVYTFMVETVSENACGLDATSATKELRILKGEIAIEADATSTVELKTVNLTVTGVAGDTIDVTATPCEDASFKAGIDDTPRTLTSNCSFTQMIKAEGVMNYAIEFTGSGTFTIIVTVVRGGPRNGEYDTVEIKVSDKTVTFVVPSAVVIGEDLTIRGTANTGDTVDIAVDDYVYALLNDLAIDETGEFRVDLNTATAGIAPFTEPGPVRLTAYINRAAGTGQVSGPGDGTAKLYMQNEAGGGIDISASETNIGKNESIILTVGAIPNRNVSVTTADSAHTAFEYNRYDFSGTSNNIINIAPADTISIPSDIGDCGSQTAAMNIHGVWNKMDGDGKLKFEVHFTETGTYTITATDYGADYPTATRLDDEEIEISVLEKNATFDLPSIVVIGDNIEIKGTAASGSSVDIFVDDMLYPLLDDIEILNGEFCEVVTTTDVGLCVPGWIKLKAYIDCDSGSPPPAIDDGLTNVFLVKPWLTASLSTDSVDQEDEFTVSGVAPGSTEVEIVCVPPKGGGGKSLTEDRKGISITTASVSMTDNTFTKNLTVQENATSGYYYILVLSPGMDGVWDITGESDLIYAIDYRYGIYDITNPCYAGTKTQEDIIEIFEDLTQSVGSDDLMQMLTIKVGEVEMLTLNPVADVIAGTPLKVTGATSREDGSIIWITVKKPYYEIVPQAAAVNDNTFNVTFDTTGAQSGTYTVKAIDGSGYTAATNVDILAETQAQTLFYTGKGSYPSIKGMNGGTITIKKMYTYSCSGTGGHSEYAAFYDQNGTLIEEGHWNGYHSGDYRYIIFDAPFTLEIGETYKYCIKTGSYPQIIHDRTYLTENGTITCTEFIDANGKRYNNWIPAIKLEE